MNNYDISQLKEEQASLLRRLNNLQVDPPIYQLTDAYCLIEEASSKLSESDKVDILEDKEYLNKVTKLNEYIQRELFKLIRNNLNANPEAVLIMKEIANYINVFKSSNDSKKEHSLKIFEDYLSNYSDMTFEEYKKLKKNL